MQSAVSKLTFNPFYGCLIDSPRSELFGQFINIVKTSSLPARVELNKRQLCACGGVRGWGIEKLLYTHCVIIYLSYIFEYEVQSVSYNLA